MIAELERRLFDFEDRLGIAAEYALTNAHKAEAIRGFAGNFADRIAALEAALRRLEAPPRAPGPLSLRRGGPCSRPTPTRPDSEHRRGVPAPRDVTASVCLPAVYIPRVCHVLALAPFGAAPSPLLILPVTPHPPGVAGLA
jgi:hypothetical protein